MIPTAAGQALLATFARVRIINLSNRSDRRREMTAELARLGIVVDGKQVAFHDASRFDDPAGFRTVGARGCFHSHLTVLEDAAGFEGSLLILEDDADFAPNIEQLLPVALRALSDERWSLFYGFGRHCSEKDIRPIYKAIPAQGIVTLHCIGVAPEFVKVAAPYLRAMLARPAGSAEGGPMDVDGAYSWLRGAYPEFQTWCADPSLAHQRASRTDISPGALDRFFLTRELKSSLRTMKRYLTRRR